MARAAGVIELDVVVTTKVLQLVNSPRYMLPYHVSSVARDLAVMLVD